MIVRDFNGCWYDDKMIDIDDIDDFDGIDDIDDIDNIDEFAEIGIEMMILSMMVSHDGHVMVA